jgi:Putative abortive phage resistance protein AbiGi, antitoxin
MSLLQRYVSKELTHFVGKRLSDEDRYRLLVDILKSGWLKHYPFNLRWSGDLSINPTASLNEMYSPEMIWFCDIPVEDFHLHMEKYGGFGLAFLKEFLVKKGANPVFYIAQNSPATRRSDFPNEIRSEFPEEPEVSRGAHFDQMSKECYDFFRALHKFLNDTYGRIDLSKLDLLNQSEESHFYDRWLDLDGRKERLERFLNFQMFSFQKFFDTTLADDHHDNFYMEREWRILGNLHFELDEVYRIILPRSYAQRLRENIPQYIGQLSFAD